MAMSSYRKRWKLFFQMCSQAIAGSQEYHEQLRGEICKFIVTEGKKFTKEYLITKFYQDTSPLAYLKRSTMTENGIWATDVEILNVSKMLNADIFLATKQHSPEHRWTRIEWLLYSGCKYPGSVCLYITNYDHHFEPVTRLKNCEYQSYKFALSTETISVD